MSLLSADRIAKSESGCKNRLVLSTACAETLCASVPKFPKRPTPTMVHRFSVAGQTGLLVPKLATFAIPLITQRIFANIFARNLILSTKSTLVGGRLGG